MRTRVAQSGWCLLRASSDQAEHPVLDDYVYATTSPIYVSVEGSVLKPADDARFFISWIDRLVDAAQTNSNWNTAAAAQRVFSFPAGETPTGIDPSIRQASEELQRLYADLLSRYGTEHPHNREAFYQYLCALDFL